MSAAHIQAVLSRLSHSERQVILDRLVALATDAEILEDRRQRYDESFRIIDEHESSDADENGEIPQGIDRRPPNIAMLQALRCLEAIHRTMMPGGDKSDSLRGAHDGAMYDLGDE